ncbi:DeoR/GlpR family DNA-binding transcription regulator [Halalkalibacillus halophilus]|uniref:DeoR/GlpR family DNA-binding transcription regulator n=1 Tax=Halalkalibacillus halophilus TaxID=392827 RepID=UPI000415BDD7|nr:DeoR/GlpR family DNA-binding transcription regulator [Halalkalibacillus halophilus]
MLPLARRQWIQQKIKENGNVDIVEISNELNVSSMTIRRDLKELEKEEKVIRTHGGAISTQSMTLEVPYSSKEGRNLKEKQAIALKASTNIPEYSTIILDSGTTTLELAKLIKYRKDLTVVTNDVKIANELIDSEVKVIVIGGEMQNEIGALFGTLAEKILQNLNVDIAFIGAHGINYENGLTAPAVEKASLKNLMIDYSNEQWLLADSSKFNKKSFATVCDLSHVSGVITNESIPKELKLKYEEKIRIVLGG